LEAVIHYFPNRSIIMHFHDTHGMAIANVVTAMQYGITRFDTALGGLGGCPYAPGAAGKVATNDVLYLLDGLGIYTGIDEETLQTASKFIQDALNKKLPSRSLSYSISQEKQHEQFERQEGVRYEQDEKATEANEAFKQKQRKREMIYFFIKNQYDRFRNNAE